MELENVVQRNGQVTSSDAAQTTGGFAWLNSKGCLGVQESLSDGNIRCLG